MVYFHHREKRSLSSINVNSWDSMSLPLLIGATSYNWNSPGKCWRLSITSYCFVLRLVIESN